jgi:PAS domain S-box-containing protein
MAVLLLVALGIVLVGVTTGLLLSHRQRSLYQDLYHAQQARAASERRLSEFLDVTDNIVTNVDGDGRFLFVNRAAAALFETSPEECIGVPAFDFVHPEDRAATRDAFAGWVADRVAGTSFENRQVSRTGRTHHLLWTINPHYAEDGALAGVWSVAVDVTERRRFERMERQRGLRAQAMLALFERSDRPTEEIVAAAVDSLVSLTESRLGFLGFVDAAEATMVTHLWSAQAMRECGIEKKPIEFDLAEGGLWADAARHRRPLIVNDYAAQNPVKKGLPEGHVQLTRFLGVPLVREGRTVLLAGLANKEEEYCREDQLETALFLEGLWDILSRKRAEEELRQTLADLARSNQELEQFAHVASHDLQEPLRMVASYTQLLARRYRGKLDDDADEFIAFAVDGAKRMQQLINDLLVYSRVKSRGKEPEPVDCSEVLRQVLSALQVTIEESGASITSDPLPTVMADEGQIAQLFQNLISNAIKFRRAEETPRVHLSARREGEEWAFSVKDNGIGIAKDYLERIFIIFQRLHGREAYPGTGIGLAICKRIVERHGGRIWAESEQAKGATFHFTLRGKEGDG